MPKAKKPQLVEMTDRTAIGVLCVFILQKAGETDDKGTQAIARDKLCLKIHLNRIKWALKALNRRGMVVVSHQQRDDNSMVQTWAVAQIDSAGWNGLEVVHVEDFLPMLMATPNAEAIVKEFADNDDADSSEKKPRKKRETDTGRFVAAIATFTTIDPFLGARIKDQMEDLFIRRSAQGRKPPEGAKLVLPRNMDGDVIIDPDHMRGWFGGNLRQYVDTSVWPAQYLAIAPGKVTLRGKTVQVDLPIQRDPRASTSRGAVGTGAGISHHEAMRPGSRIQFYFNFPTKGFMSPIEMRAFLMCAGLMSPRHISPRGKKYGRLLLTDFKVRGALRVIHNALDQAVATLPKSVREKHKKVIDNVYRLTQDMTFGYVSDEYLKDIAEQCAALDAA
jgi:hypothetical protein